jgi:hypothetical protein
MQTLRAKVSQRILTKADRLFTNKGKSGGLLARWTALGPRPLSPAPQVRDPCRCPAPGRGVEARVWGRVHH